MAAQSSKNPTCLHILVITQHLAYPTQNRRAKLKPVTPSSHRPVWEIVPSTGSTKSEQQKKNCPRCRREVKWINKRISQQSPCSNLRNEANSPTRFEKHPKLETVETRSPPPQCSTWSPRSPTLERIQWRNSHQHGGPTTNRLDRIQCGSKFFLGRGGLWWFTWLKTKGPAPALPRIPLGPPCHRRSPLLYLPFLSPKLCSPQFPPQFLRQLAPLSALSEKGPPTRRKKTTIMGLDGPHHKAHYRNGPLTFNLGLQWESIPLSECII